MELIPLKKKLEKNIETTAKLLYEFPRGSKLLKAGIILALFITFFNPKTIGKAIDLAHSDWKLPFFYPIAYYIVIAIIFIYAVKMRLAEINIERKAERLKNASLPSSIKGPNAFTAKDTKLFSELQRNGDIQKLKEAIMHPDYRFGILTAVSGCGKTSLLNAGLGPAIRDKHTHCLIVTISNQTLIEAVKRSVLMQEGIQLTSAEGAGLFEIIKELAAHFKKVSWVVIFDQFEQFFIHNAIDQRLKIIDELQLLLVQLPQIKLLISIRNDFFDSMREVQVRLGYTLDANSNYFALSNFTPDQAVAIFGVIAKKENIQFVDKLYLKTFCSTDLASAGNGLVSPIDIQIIAMVVNAYKELEVAFNYQTFKQLGGVNGMLKRYIIQNLAVQNYFNEQNEGLYVLLTLIGKYEDGRVIRAGRLSILEIRKKMVTGISGNDLVKVLDWLENCKLVRRVAEDTTKYEIAHEKLIEPILRISNESETDLRKANVVLERRTAEWVSNSRSRAYLLSVGEYFSIRRYKNAISWGNNEPVKRDYLQASRTWIRRKFLGWSALVILLISSYFIYQTDWVIKQYRIRSDAFAIYSDPSSHVKGANNVLDYFIDIAPDFVYQSLQNHPPGGINYNLLAELAASYPDRSATGKNLWKEAYSYCDSGSIQMKYEALAAILSRAPKGDLNKICRQFENIKRSANDTGHSFVKDQVLAGLAIRIASRNVDSAMNFVMQMRTPEQDVTYERIAEKIAGQNPAKALEIVKNLKFMYMDERAREQIAIARHMPENASQKDSLFAAAVNWLVHSAYRDFGSGNDGRYMTLTEQAAFVPPAYRRSLLNAALNSALQLKGKDNDGNSSADAKDAGLADLAVRSVEADPALSAKCYSMIADNELKIEVDIFKAYVFANKDKSKAEMIWNDVSRRINTLPVNVLEGRLFLKNLGAIAYSQPNPLKEKILDRIIVEIGKGSFANGSAADVQGAVVVQYEKARLFRSAYFALSYSYFGVPKLRQLAVLYLSWMNNKYTDPDFERPIDYESMSRG